MPEKPTETPNPEAPFAYASQDGLSPALLGSVGVLLLAVLFIIYRLLKLQWDEQAAKRRTAAIIAATEGEDRPRREAEMAGGRRRGGPRRRVNHEEDFFDQLIAEQQGGDDDEDDDEDFDYRVSETGEKIGKRKAMKLQAKAEKKAHREQELRDREEQKIRDAEKEKRREDEREKERLEEEAEEERKRKEKEEKEKREHEEYLAMKASFAVEEEGFDIMEGEEAENLLKEFVDYVKKSKVVNMDELAAHFDLKSDQAVNRLQFFLENGQLQGVVDDRGKFIYITNEELDAVAKFINQRGRFSIHELAEYSNKLVNLEGEED
ncbi:unnamed protein product [Auanema sp. JU1783]|nr:unnamed protein product [Auanema sp. JU1783]